MAAAFYPWANMGTPGVSVVQNFPMPQASPVLVGTVTATGTTAASAAANAFGSSVSLQRIVLNQSIALSEVDLVLGIAFPATNQGQGSLSQSFAVYSFGNSTSLASVLSASRAVTWATGTTTSGTSSSLQQGWSGPNIQPMTFASTVLNPGEYVVGHLLSMAAASTSWTISLYGMNAFGTATGSAVTTVTTGTLGAMSSGGLAAVSALTGTTATAYTAFSATPTSAPVFLTATGTSVALIAGSLHTGSTAANVLSSAGFNAGSVHTASTSATLTAFSAAPSAFAIGKVGSTASGVTNTASLVSVTATAAASTISLLFNTATGGFNILSSGGLLAGSFHTGSTSAAAFSAGGLLAGSFLTASGIAGVVSNAGTAGINLVSAGLSAGSFIGTFGSIAAITAVGVGTGAATIASVTTPRFGYNGSIAMTTATSQAVYQAGPFIAGVFLSGSMPTSIDLKSTAAIVTASQALVQPWFALVGA
jgi:hypothetical protein